MLFSIDIIEGLFMELVMLILCGALAITTAGRKSGIVDNPVKNVLGHRFTRELPAGEGGAHDLVQIHSVLLV